MENSLLIGNGLLLAMLGFFVKNLITKFETQNTIIASLDKTVAVMAKEMENYKREVEHFYGMEKRIDKDLKDVRERGHVLGNDINGIMLKCQICTQKFSELGEKQ